MAQEKRSPNFEAELMRIIPVIHREIMKRHELISSEKSLAISHIVILDLLRDKKILHMGELARTLNMSMSAATAIIDKMVELALVERARSQEDRRIVNVSATKKGEGVLQAISRSRLEIISQMFSVFTSQEKQTYLKLIKKVHRGLKENK
ncbi:MAG: MarR family transcriptional regulator [Candidatus Omnitrophica bacterium]|nr:MarR family transcriptional regulator [Candidatus Omnitrophota bacterium]